MEKNNTKTHSHTLHTHKTEQNKTNTPPHTHKTKQTKKKRLKQTNNQGKKTFLVISQKHF